MPVARFGLILNLLVPLIFLIADAFKGQLGADQVKEAIHTTGLVAVTFLVASLAITPVKMVTNWGWLIQFRRSVGVFAFYYACAHLAIYFWWDRERSLSSTVYEITHRYYLLIGFFSLVLMASVVGHILQRRSQGLGREAVEAVAQAGLCGSQLGLHPFLPTNQSR